ncbi:MAG: hypothetical protein HQM13_23200 [SAR324 cluster bacterium]|nr:hypothetical protein [SAR324 cluster bacterium]
MLKKSGVEDADFLLDQINKDLNRQINEREVKLRARNLVAVSGNSLVVLFKGWILKYPLN